VFELAAAMVEPDADNPDVYSPAIRGTTRQSVQ
jgi:hypothetical protein